jgi:hypothetical protein
MRRSPAEERDESSVRKELADAQKQSADYQTKMADLQDRLESQAKGADASEGGRHYHGRRAEKTDRMKTKSCAGSLCGK